MQSAYWVQILVHDGRWGPDAQSETSILADSQRRDVAVLGVGSELRRVGRCRRLRKRTAPAHATPLVGPVWVSGALMAGLSTPERELLALGASMCRY